MNRNATLLLASAVFAASVIAPLARAQSADDDWNGVTALTLPINASRGQGTASDVSVQKEIDRLWVLSDRARTFAGKYPRDGRVSAAKKLEAMAELQIVQLGSADERSTAFRVANAFRHDVKNPAKDRFDVAFSMELMDAAASMPAHDPRRDGVVYEGVADTLYKEFGDIDSTYALYIDVARTTDMAAAGRVAKKLLKMSAPDWAKAHAQLLADRDAMLHRAVDITLTSVRGESVDLKKTNKRPTMVVVWDASTRTPTLPALAAIDVGIGQATNWVYVGIGEPFPNQGDLNRFAPFPGIHCFDPEGLRGPISRALKVQQLPYLYVIDSKGNLSGFGPVSEAMNLLKSATR